MSHVVSERQILFEPARDNKLDRWSRSVQGVMIRFILRESDWALELVIMTPWVLPETREWWATLQLPDHPGTISDAALHHRAGTGEFIVAAGVCSVFPNDRCENIPLSAFEGDRMFAVLIAGGHDALWHAMEERLVELKTQAMEVIIQ